MLAAKQAYFAPDTIDVRGLDGYGTFPVRKLRYKFLEAVANQDAFRSTQDWPEKFKSNQGMYRYTRDVLGIGFQLAEFWATHLQGGALDPDAGNGKGEIASALPILMKKESPAVRFALAELWKRSNWPTKKDVFTRLGATLGDVFIEAVNDTEKGRIRLNVVNPGRVRWVDPDAEGNIQGYCYEFTEIEIGRAHV